MRQLQESIGIRCLVVASRTVRLEQRIPNIHIRVVAPDTKIPTMSILYIALLAGFQIGIQEGSSYV
jgi:hypothetical protein